jgi:transcriptional regulator with XRE-family HTH domain
MRAVGVGWRRQTVTKLENGYREDVSVAELLALGQVLQCPPVHLIVPPDAVTYRVTAGTELPAAAARDWIRGKTVLPGHEIRNYLAELPREEAEGLWNAG